MKLLVEFDEKNETAFALKSDSEFTNAELRYLHNKNAKTAKQLHQYFWRTISLNSNSNCVLFACVKKAEDVTVCSHIYLLFSIYY